MMIVLFLKRRKEVMKIQQEAFDLASFDIVG
jgi:hypothetical protein